MTDLEAPFKHAVGFLELGIEACAALVITWGVLQAFWLTLRAAMAPRDEHARESIRLGLGRWLALALEFELAADILGTAVAPTWGEIGKVAAIIALRTALNYFLQREIKELAAERRGPVAGG